MITNSGNTKSARVMVCDDDQELLRLFQLALEQTYEVLRVSSGKECLEKYIEEKNKGNKIDVLLLDYKLGDMTGEDVACKIRELDGTNTILISAYEIEKEVISQLKKKGCIVDTVSKPISMYLLKKLVQSAIK
ncbi:MAG: response regulator [Thermoproteota archaeon]|nr:response regulator [Thermoproteota archaeon]